MSLRRIRPRGSRESGTNHPQNLTTMKLSDTSAGSEAVSTESSSHNCQCESIRQEPVTVRTSQWLRSERQDIALELRTRLSEPLSSPDPLQAGKTVFTSGSIHRHGVHSMLLPRGFGVHTTMYGVQCQLYPVAYPGRRFVPARWPRLESCSLDTILAHHKTNLCHVEIERSRGEIQKNEFPHQPCVK